MGQTITCLEDVVQTNLLSGCPILIHIGNTAQFPDF